MTNKALRIAYQKPSELKKYKNNSRTHSDSQIEQVEKSISEFGFTNPILIDENAEVIAGHARLQAALNLELDKVPTITLAGLSDAQKKAYVIADNKMALNSGWDEEILMAELESLDKIDFDLGLTGFDDGEIDKLFNVEDETKSVSFNVNMEDKFQLLVEYESEQELQAAFEQAQKQGLQCKIIQ